MHRFFSTNEELLKITPVKSVKAIELHIYLKLHINLRNENLCFSVAAAVTDNNISKTTHPLFCFTSIFKHNLPTPI